MEKQGITTYDKDRAFKLTELLLECGYVCMLSREEGLYECGQALDWSKDD